NGPAHQASAGEPVETERPWTCGPRLLGIRTDDLEVARLTERDQEVASAEAGMGSSGRWRDAEQCRHRRDTGGEIGNRVDQMIEVARNRHRRSARAGAM